MELKGRMERGEEFSSSVTGVHGAQLKIAFMGTSNCVVELIEYVTPGGVKVDSATNNVGSAHVAFNVQGLDPMVERALAAGATMRGAPTHIPSGPNIGKRAVYLEDPDGNTIEFISEEVYPAGS